MFLLNVSFVHTILIAGFGTDNISAEAVFDLEKAVGCHATIAAGVPLGLAAPSIYSGYVCEFRLGRADRFDEVA